MHICILGAGIIGVTSAYQLLQDGHEVTLIDARSAPGEGTSLGNGAQLSYSYVAPLADPSIWRDWPHYLFASDSPLTYKPRMEIAQWQWLTRFLRACNRTRAQQTTIALLQLAFLSRDRLHGLQQQVPLSFHHKTTGKLVMYTDPAGLAAAQRQVDFQSQYGCEQQVIDAARCIEIEPALAHAQRDWAGGVYTPSEEAGDCAAFCKELVNSMSASSQFHFMPGTRISSVSLEAGKMRAIVTNQGNIDADAFVLALGSDSAQFARRLGFYLPVYPLKGYSITVPLAQPAAQAAAPQVSITDISRKIVYARLGDQLRVAGRVEIVGRNQQIPQRAIDELKQGVRELFPGAAQLRDDASLQPWAGFRPATPSGLPIVDASPVPNLYLNVGQGSLGWTLACGSAALLSAKISRRTLPIDDAPFRLAQGA